MPFGLFLVGFLGRKNFRPENSGTFASFAPFLRYELPKHLLKNPSRNHQGTLCWKDNVWSALACCIFCSNMKQCLVSFFVQSVVFRQENLQCTAAFVSLITRTACRSRKANYCLAVAADSAVSRYNSNLGIRNALVRRPRALCS